jgi:monovalent cation:H+ antiporter, CPA1 family
MTGLEVAAVLICLAAAMGYLNAKFLRLPSAIGLMAIGLLGSFAILGLDVAGLVDSAALQAFVSRIDFAHVLMHGLLGFLLFAGALHVDLADLAVHKWSILALALLGTLLSTFLIGAGTWLLLTWCGIPLPFLQTLLFGALISPTDPIAVLGIMRSAKVSNDLAVQISGESLFNDGIGVVLFVVIAAAAGGTHPSAAGMAVLFLREAVGGAIFGLALGYVAYRVLRSIDDYSVEVLITLAVVVGGYGAAERLHVSAPIAAVVSGLVVGNHGRRLGMSDETRRYVDMFWKLVDEILNAVLFLLLGLQATRLQVNRQLALAMALVVPLALLARLASVGMTVPLLGYREPHAVKILTWGGLRGGISVALALSLPDGAARGTILALTYAVVAFAILVQGMTLGGMLRRLEAKARSI